MNSKPRELNAQQNAVYTLLLTRGTLNVLDISEATKISLQKLKVIMWQLITRDLAIRNPTNPETYTARRRDNP